MCSIGCLGSSSSQSNTTTASSSSLCSVEPLVPLLSLLEHHGSHHGTHHDSQQGAQQQQEHLPAGERRPAEVSRRIVDVVCEGRRRTQTVWIVYVLF